MKTEWERDTNSRWNTSTSWDQLGGFVLSFFFTPQQARKADKAPPLGGNSAEEEKGGIKHKERIKNAGIGVTGIQINFGSCHVM